MALHMSGELRRLVISWCLSPRASSVWGIKTAGDLLVISRLALHLSEELRLLVICWFLSPRESAVWGIKTAGDLLSPRESAV
jgi:hypothetical protein